MILLLLQAAPAPSAAREFFDLEGELSPPHPASISVHGVDTPYSGSAAIYAGGKFRFRKLKPGAYTIAVYVPRLGELRQTQSVGPGTADKKGRVRVTIFCNAARASKVEEHTVSIARVAIPKEAAKAYEAAQRSQTRGDADAAIANLKTAVQLAPRFAAAWNNLGTIAYQRRQYTEAEAHFRQGRKADPQAYEPKVNLGGVLLNLGKLEEALTINAECVEQKPMDPLANSQLGMTYFQKGDLALAERFLLEARRLDPAHFSLPQLTLAEIYLRQGRAKEARAEWERFLRHHPDHPRAAEIRARLRP